MDKTERLTITETSNYGIGLLCPATKLDIDVKGSVSLGNPDPRTKLYVQNNDIQEPKKDVTPANR